MSAIDRQAMTPGPGDQARGSAPAARYESVELWDLPTRILHWLNATSVIGLLLTGFLFMYRRDLGLHGAEPEAMLQSLHSLIGYVLVTGLAARLLWGFFGNAFVRWSAHLRPLAALEGFFAELRAVLAGDEPGPHGRLARSAITQVVAIVFFIVMSAQSATGLVRAGTDLFWPPFGGFVAAELAKPGVDPADINWRTAGELVDPDRGWAISRVAVLAGQLHKYGGYLMLVLVGLHVCGVVTSEVRERSGVVSTMISGRRLIRRSGEPPAA